MFNRGGLLKTELTPAYVSSRRKPSSFETLLSISSQFVRLHPTLFEVYQTLALQVL